MDVDPEEGPPEAGRGGVHPGARPPRPSEPNDPARPFDPAQGQVAPLARLRQARLSEAHSMLLVQAFEREQDASDEEE